MCDHIDTQIDHATRLVDSLTDPLTQKRPAELVEQLKAKRAALHPDEEKE